MNCVGDSLEIRIRAYTRGGMNLVVIRQKLNSSVSWMESIHQGGMGYRCEWMESWAKRHALNTGEEGKTA